MEYDSALETMKKRGGALNACREGRGPIREGRIPDDFTYPTSQEREADGEGGQVGGRQGLGGGGQRRAQRRGLRGRRPTPRDALAKARHVRSNPQDASRRA